MRKVLVQSVGTGTRPGQAITEPLVWHVQRSGADFIAWIVSDESRANAERMARELSLCPDGYEIRAITTIEDVERVYRDCRALFRDLATRGFAAEVIEVDYTSGTKAMTAGLVLAAVAHGCGTLSYIAGERRSGVVESGTERLVPIEPRRMWADERLRLACDYCRALRFDAALALLDSVKDAWLGDYERLVAEGLRSAANGYGAWDRFDFARATGELWKLAEAAAPELLEFQPDREALTRLPALKPALGISADRLADLFNNAGRRLAEGRYDDALARLYRLAEMFAQWILRKEFSIETADVDVAKVPDELRDKLAATRNAGGAIQIGLDWDYRLLKAKGHEVGRRFDHGEFSGIGVLLKQRNESLLAHGLVPIGRKDVESLRDKLLDLLAIEAPDFRRRCTALEFPWRRV